MKKPPLAALLNAIPLGLGYLYLGRHGRFAFTFYLGLTAPLIGVVLGPVIIDGVLAQMSDCHGGFSEVCPRAAWDYTWMILGWAFPSMMIAVFSAWNAYKIATPKDATGSSA